MSKKAVEGNGGDALYIYSFEIMILVRVLAGVSQSVKRGETIVQQKGYNLIDP
ncbi:MAG: hypothetical protein JRJ38_06285 [Deltaproteobacteria bacterium]|nr:hypothetical protein [Deltaproteobacteria bacterium]